MAAVPVMAQSGLTDMSNSQQAIMTNTPLGSVKWTGGFWADRFNVMSTTGIWSMWDTWNTPWETIDALGLHGSNGFRNFEVAAGTVKGKHHGPPFHDGDMYKWLEACATVYAITKDPKLDALMDKFIEQVALAQRADGYIHTPVVISERNAGIDSHANAENAAGIEIGKVPMRRMRQASRLARTRNTPLPRVSTSRPTTSVTLSQPVSSISVPPARPPCSIVAERQPTSSITS